MFRKEAKVIYMYCYIFLSCPATWWPQPTSIGHFIAWPKAEKQMSRHSVFHFKTSKETSQFVSDIEGSTLGFLADSWSFTAEHQWGTEISILVYSKEREEPLQMVHDWAGLFWLSWLLIPIKDWGPCYVETQLGTTLTWKDNMYTYVSERCLKPQQQIWLSESPEAQCKGPAVRSHKDICTCPQTHMGSRN